VRARVYVCGCDARLGCGCLSVWESFFVFACIAPVLFHSQSFAFSSTRLIIGTEGMGSDDSITPRQRRRRLIVVTVCPTCSLLLTGMILWDGLLPRRASPDAAPRRQFANALEIVEDMGVKLRAGEAMNVWPASTTYGKVPCAINISGYECPDGYGASMNTLFMLQAADDSGTPAYRSSGGYWLAHSPHACFTRETWLISKTRPDAKADTHMCDLEAHIFHSTALPVGRLQWSYVSCGTAGDPQAGRRWLMLEPVRQCDCPTAGHASEREPA
jgi:hypothetical protein